MSAKMLWALRELHRVLPGARSLAVADPLSRVPRRSQSRRGSTENPTRAVNRLSLIAVLLACSLSKSLLSEENSSTLSKAATHPGEGRQLIEGFIEANRYWLLGPSPGVKRYRYSLNRIGTTQEFEVENPGHTPRARRQAVTYSTMLHQIASRPGSVTVRSLTRTGELVRLTLAFDPPVRGACGNGVEDSWYGYFNLGGEAGYLVLDATRLVPLEAGMGRLTETFSEFVPVDSSHYVPLAIAIQKDDMHFDWRFRLYEPGLWLFDDCHYNERRVVWVDRVRVNEEAARLRQAVPESVARAEAEASGERALQVFLEANRHWLLPSLNQRRGLIYEYRQEPPYVERVLFDAEGNVMVRLVASKESPTTPTRQTLWLADGRQVSGNSLDTYVSVEPHSSPAQHEPKEAEPRTHVDRHLQNLAMGLGWDCALTRLAREPDAFWVERLVADDPGQYRLVAHQRQETRLFAGTMLSFTSWAYMHDVSYERSEILCDAATHRPLVERDFAGRTELKGEFYFEDWQDTPSGATPGRIRAVVPYEKDGEDQSLEMDAHFRINEPDIWLLDHVQSHFRGSHEGSTGTVNVVATKGGFFPEIAELLTKAHRTETVVQTVRSAPEGIVETEVPWEGWKALPLRAEWTEEAGESAHMRDEPLREDRLIGIWQARFERERQGRPQLTLEGVSTTRWQEFETEWKVSWREDSGRLLATTTTNMVVRTESQPAAFQVHVPGPASLPSAQTSPALISIQGTVLRMTGAYHGHGIWYHFARQN